MSMKSVLRSAAAAIAIVFASFSAAAASDLTAKSVVLVHGAFADASSWKHVTPILEKAGLDVIAVQNPLDSLAGDVAFTNRAIDRAKGPVVLVGHSWGGAVITEAGIHDKIKSIVYVAAYAPDAGQNLLDAAALDRHPAPGIAALKKDAAGYFYLPDDAMKKYFAPDLSDDESTFMAASQGLINSKALGEPVTHTAWSKKPTFYAISGNDFMTPTALQREFAKKMGAIAREIDASHSIMVSQPQFVADLIIEAAK